MTINLLPMATQDLLWQVTRNAERQDRRTSAPRCSSTPASARSSPTTWSTSAGRRSGGWHRPRVQAYGPIALDPAAAVLHYAQEVFEGLKAYRHADGSIWTFRPDQNAARMQRSAKRLALPELPTEYFIDSLKQLDRRRRRLGADAGRDEPLPASVHVREGGVPRRAPRGEGQLLRDRVAGRRLLLAAASPRSSIWLSTDVHPRRPRRHGPGEDRRQLRVVARRAAGGLRATGASRCCSSTPRRASTSKSSAA